MANSEEIYFCFYCKKKTLHLQIKINHILHLLLTILTIGFWVIIWFCLVFLKDKEPTCKECGEYNSHFAQDTYIPDWHIAWIEAIIFGIILIIMLLVLKQCGDPRLIFG
jgi:hypothetical protein